jgi:spore maturation protein CgeB
MRAAGWSPSVRLFEAAACGVPVISDPWDGLEELFAAGSEIVIAETQADVIWALSEMPDVERRAIGERARRKVLAEHTAARRIDQLESLIAVAA